MDYINLQTMAYPVSEWEIKQANKNTSFPIPFVPPVDYAPVQPTDKPPFDRFTQKVVEAAPVKVGGQWQQAWQVVALTPEESATAVAGLQAEVVAATQQRLDAFARTRNYDGILSACTYATSSVPKFASEGQYAVNARDATWAALYQIMAEVQQGTRPMPSGFADIEADLPAMEWPA